MVRCFKIFKANKGYNIEAQYNKNLKVYQKKNNLKISCSKSRRIMIRATLISTRLFMIMRPANTKWPNWWNSWTQRSNTKSC
jgi:hypothetical protein